MLAGHYAGDHVIQRTEGSHRRQRVRPIGCVRADIGVQHVNLSGVGRRRSWNALQRADAGEAEEGTSGSRAGREAG